MVPQTRFRYWPVVVLISLLVAGCGKGQNGPDRYEVSGTITFQGKPLSHGSIQFVNSGTGSGGGAVIRDGKYEIPAKKGLPAGKYRVMITSGAANEADGDVAPGESGPLAKELIPASYNTESSQSVDVTPDGPNEFNYTIK